MDGSDGSPPQSICMIRVAEFFPKPLMEKEDKQLTVPFQELAGESVKYLGRTDDGVLALSNYRIFVLKNSNNSETSVPLGLIESAQTRDLFHLIINCKDASTVKCSFETAEQCCEWQRRIQLCVGVPESLESLFAFAFYSWLSESIAQGDIGQQRTLNADNSHILGFGLGMEQTLCDYKERLQRATRHENDFMHEVERLGFDLNGPWRISEANKDFKLCPSYPQKLLVPCCIADDTLQEVANFRGSRRLPVIVWRHKQSGAVLARSSQPEVGWLGWRNSKDEQLLKALADACAFDRGEQLRRYGLATTTANGSTQIPINNIIINSGSVGSESPPISPDGSHEEVAMDEVRKVLIVDARSYTSAVTNRARGGGCECIEYYPCAEIEFMNLGNIHVIRKSFHALRQLCASAADVPNWLGLLEKTMWLQHLSGLLAASMTVVHAIDKKGRPVLVHCSDGWDRTPQIIATAQICLDPYYRTVEGFRLLVEREWLSFGHKFADRCGHGPGSDELNERCPVFLQWLDLIHQIHKQYPCSFEFSMGYLIKLAQHSLSCLFGTFLCNTLNERIKNAVFERTFSVWPFLSGPMYRNPLYVPNRDKVLWPAHNVRDLSLWTEVYLGSLGNQNSMDFPGNNSENGGVHETITQTPMTKTRSYGDLIKAGIMQNGISRRSSDPNMTLEPNLTIGSSSENDSLADMQSEREDSPDRLANLIHDTTCKLQNLTIELNNHDDKDFKKIYNVDDNNILESTVNENKVKSFTTTHTSPKKDFLNFEQSKQQKQQSLLNNNDETSSNELLNEQFNKVIEKHKTNDTNTDSMHSVDLINTVSLDAKCDGMHNLWHGSVNNSTDTLVPVTENLRHHHTKHNFNGVCLPQTDTTDSSSDATTTTNEELSKKPQSTQVVNGNKSVSYEKLSESMMSSTNNLIINNTKINNNNNNNNSYNSSSSILPKVHSNNNKSNFNISTALTATITDAITSGSYSYATSSSSTVSSSSFNNLNKLITTTTSYDTYNNALNNLQQQQEREEQTNINLTNDEEEEFCNGSIMEDSIMILPEHQKLEISLSGNCESIFNQVTMPFSMATNNNDNNSNNLCQAIVTATSNSYCYSPFTTTTVCSSMQQQQQKQQQQQQQQLQQQQERRRRTSSSNSRREQTTTTTTITASHIKQTNSGSINSRFSLPGVRSLPMTSPALSERPPIAISCPDGLAHALSEQNIRLQQIVHEHKLREDLLLREIHDMRMALLKKFCPNCNNAATTAASAATANDEQCSGIDNIENVSVCSWEAVEDRSGPSSCTSSSIQQNGNSVLWVPDYAVSRCTSCQTEFWLGRRKHHCRSCGQIFCADCSEFWAPLPDEKLFNPVRLCGPCYHAVTTRIQVSQLRDSALLQQLQQNATKTVVANVVANATSAPAVASSKA